MSPFRPVGIKGKPCQSGDMVTWPDATILICWLLRKTMSKCAKCGTNLVHDREIATGKVKEPNTLYLEESLLTVPFTILNTQTLTFSWQ